MANQAVDWLVFRLDGDCDYVIRAHSVTRFLRTWHSCARDGVLTLSVLNIVAPCAFCCKYLSTVYMKMSCL